MHALQAAFKVFLQRIKGLGCRMTPRNHDIVEISLCELVAELAESVLQSSPDPIPDDGIADFLGDCETKSWA